MALALCAVLAPAAAVAVSSPVSGLVVEEVRAGTAGQKAGLLPGDVLVSWRRDPLPGSSAAGLPASGDLALPFDLTEVLLEQMPRARVTLVGRRGTEEVSWVLPRGAASYLDGIRAEPLLPEGLLVLAPTERIRLDAAGFEAGAAPLRAAVAAARARGAERLAAWFLVEGARQMKGERRWEEASVLYSEAVALDVARRDPALAAQLYREWGDLFQQRFAWDRAQECYERALAEDRKKGFASLGESWSLAELGMFDVTGGGPKEEGELFRQAIEIRERLAPGSAEHARAWMQWANAGGMTARWPDCIVRFRKALELLPENGPSRLLRAEALAGLAFVLDQNGDPRDAEEAGKAWQSAYALVMEEAPEDYLVVGITLGLGRRAAARGDLARAEAFLVQSLQLCRRHRPGSLEEAQTLRELGRLQAGRGKWKEGAGHLCEALAGIEAWHAKLQARLDTRHWWGRLSADYHRDCADALVETGRDEDAFAAIERGRARAFLDLLAERGLRLAALAPERGTEWRQLNAEYERAQEDLRRAGAREAPLEEVVNLEGRLREIRRKKERLLERDLPAAAVRYRQPLRLAEARRSLEPGTALLLYSIGRTRTLLFVLLPEGMAGAAAPSKTPGWAVLSLPVGEAELKKKVEQFQKALVKDRFNPRGFEGQAKDLYKLLVQPAEAFVSGAERVVVAPDGPLHTLPFAALKRGDQFLVEWKPLHFTLSATAYSEQRSKRGVPGLTAVPAAPPRLVAFGDPSYAPALPDASLPADDGGLRKLLGQSVAPLPATREEVLGIASLFPGARVFLGGQVNEDEVKEAVRGASLIHFAVHGVFNERAPQNSALVLSASSRPGEEASNALLQGWEVMESLPLDADLVTLSACDTALGREVGGEGLVGLTRAFQHAGARSVVATLWGISDRSTADFMKKFYGALQEGKTKDEALRAAQMAQIRSKKPQPFYWAAFELFGDWR